MLWSDDFHHVARVAATGRREAYYGDYLGSPQELVSVAEAGVAVPGPVGPPAGEAPRHAGAGHRAVGVHRLPPEPRPGRELGPGRAAPRADDARPAPRVTALQLLGPATPMLFQGQEFAASSPFLYFSDQEPSVAEELVAVGASSSRSSPAWRRPRCRSGCPTPAAARRSSGRSSTRPSARARMPRSALHRDLLRLRREDATIRGAASRRGRRRRARPEAFVLRWFDPASRAATAYAGQPGRRVGPRRLPNRCWPPPEGRRWRVLWSSEDPRYGGRGTPEPESEQDNWRLAAQAAFVMAPRRQEVTSTATCPVRADSEGPEPWRT